MFAVTVHGEREEFRGQRARRKAAVLAHNYPAVRGGLRVARAAARILGVTVTGMPM